jgi:general secretion pathway protein G
VEVFMVLTLISVILGVGYSYFSKAREQAKLAALKDDLKKMRDGIEKFHELFRRYPKELRELEGKLLKQIPVDPFTGKVDWTTEPPPREKDAKGNETQPEGIYDVHCPLADVGPDGKPLKDH